MSLHQLQFRTLRRYNLREIGCKTFRLLLDQIRGNDNVQQVVVKARLELRESTR